MSASVVALLTLVHWLVASAFDRFPGMAAGTVVGIGCLLACWVHGAIRVIDRG